MREIKFKIYNIAQFTQYKAQNYEFKEYMPYSRVFYGKYALISPTEVCYDYMAAGKLQTVIGKQSITSKLCFCVR